MRIVQLVYHLGFGGGEKFVVNLSNQLAENGHEVIIVQLRNDTDSFDIHFNRQFLSPKVKYLNLGLTKGFTFKKAMKVMCKLYRLKADIIHSHLNILPYYYLLTLFPGKTKFVHTLHNVAEKETEISWQQKINHWIYKHNFIIPITISPECQKSFTNLYHIPSPICINNGTPPVRATPDIERVKIELRSLCNTDNCKILLHVGRFNEQKNHRLLIESFNQIIKDGFDAELFIIGGKFDTPPGLELQKKACCRIHFLGTRHNVCDYMLNSDFFILSSFWEGLPISLIEAMSAKLIPISTPAGGVPNVITDGYNGFISSDYSQQEFVKTIKRALNSSLDPNLIYQSYMDNYSMTKCANAYELAYNQK